jgi:exopolysaccharide production protein ExoQ
MNMIFEIAVAIGPYYLTALLLGLLAGAFTPWLWMHPEKWIFFFIFALSVIVVGGGGSDTEGSLFKQFFWGLLFVFVIAKLAWKDGGIEFSESVSLPIGLLILLIYICLSILWSPYVFVSFKRAVQVVGVIAIGLLVARQALQGRGLLDQVLMPLGLLILIGLAVAVLAPKIAFDSDHALQSITNQKNSWGQISLFSCFVYLSALSRVHVRNYLLLLVMLLLSVISLVATKSMTSLLSFMLVSGLLFMWFSAAKWGAIGKIFLIVSVGLGMLALLGYFVSNGEMPLDWLANKVFASTGKSDTLTGRTYLWHLMSLEIEQHQWLGTGFGGFWTGVTGASGVLVSKLNWGPPSQAHNCYLDVLNEIGIVGAMLLLMVLLKHAANVIKLLRTDDHGIAIFHGAILLSSLIINYAESSLLRTTDLWWVVLCVSIIEVHARCRQESRTQGGLQSIEGAACGWV